MNFPANVFDIGPAPQQAADQSVVLAQQSQEKMFGFDERRPVLACFGMCPVNRAPGSYGVAVEHCRLLYAQLVRIVTYTEQRLL